jgi:hypothetical protein
MPQLSKKGFDPFRNSEGASGQQGHLADVNTKYSSMENAGLPLVNVLSTSAIARAFAS